MSGEREEGEGEGDAQLSVRMLSCRLGMSSVAVVPPAAAMSACTAASQLKVTTAAGTWETETGSLLTCGSREECEGRIEAIC